MIRPRPRPKKRDTRSRQAIISAFVDFFAARSINNLFDMDGEEYERQYEMNGDLTKQLHKKLRKHLPSYFQIINIPIKNNLSKNMLFDIEYVIAEALATQTYNTEKTRREWLRLKLSQCIDSVLLMSAKVLSQLEKLVPVDKARNQLATDYNAMLARHQKELDKWKQRETQMEDQMKSVQAGLAEARKHRRETLANIGPTLFDATEARYSQYVDGS